MARESVSYVDSEAASDVEDLWKSFSGISSAEEGKKGGWREREEKKWEERIRKADGGVREEKKAIGHKRNRSSLSQKTKMSKKSRESQSNRGGIAGERQIYWTVFPRRLGKTRSFSVLNGHTRVHCVSRLMELAGYVHSEVPDSHQTRLIQAASGDQEALHIIVTDSGRVEEMAVSLREHWTAPGDDVGKWGSRVRICGAEGIMSAKEELERYPGVVV